MWPLKLFVLISLEHGMVEAPAEDLDILLPYVKIAPLDRRRVAKRGIDELTRKASEPHRQEIRHRLEQNINGSKVDILISSNDKKTWIGQRFKQWSIRCNFHWSCDGISSDPRKDAVIEKSLTKVLGLDKQLKKAALDVRVLRRETQRGRGFKCIFSYLGSVEQKEKEEKERTENDGKLIHEVNRKSLAAGHSHGYGFLFLYCKALYLDAHQRLKVFDWKDNNWSLVHTW